MIRGSRSSCHRAFLAVLAVVLCVVAPVSAAARTRTHFATSESMTALWVARERGLFEKPWPGDAVCGHAVPATGARGIAGGETDAAMVGPGHDRCISPLTFHQGKSERQQ